jgi:hypothetical protein
MNDGLSDDIVSTITKFKTGTTTHILYLSHYIIVEQKAKSRITKAYQKLQVQNCNFPTNLKIQTQKLKFSIVIPAKAGIQEPEVFVKKRKNECL